MLPLTTSKRGPEGEQSIGRYSFQDLAEIFEALPAKTAVTRCSVERVRDYDIVIQSQFYRSKSSYEHAGFFETERFISELYVEAIARAIAHTGSRRRACVNYEQQRRIRRDTATGRLRDRHRCLS